jgi:hypothetical protein
MKAKSGRNSNTICETTTNLINNVKEFYFKNALKSF